MTENRRHTPCILITPRFEESWLQELQQLVPDWRIEPRPDARVADISDEIWRDVEIIFTLSTLPQPEQAPNLRWVQLYSAGANQALDNPLLTRGVTFTTASGVHALNIAEYIFATLLAWTHRLSEMFAWKQRGHWPSNRERNTLFLPEELAGKTINIVGYGSIGRQTARLAKAFGMRVLALVQGENRRDRGFSFPDVGDPEGNLPDEFYTPERFHEMLGRSDVVVLTVPLTPATTHMIDEAALRAMKPTAFLINIARGDVCDEEALIRALQEGWIAGAALDVFHQEPLPPESPLYRLPNVLMSPHIAGLTPDYDERAARIFLTNMRRYLAGEPLLNAVSAERGY